VRVLETRLARTLCPALSLCLLPHHHHHHLLISHLTALISSYEDCEGLLKYFQILKYFLKSGECGGPGLSLSLSLTGRCLALLHSSTEVSVRSIPTCQMSPVSPGPIGSCLARGRRRTNERTGERLVVAGPGRQEVSSGLYYPASPSVCGVTVSCPADTVLDSK
jgi:hypothetical protein